MASQALLPYDRGDLAGRGTGVVQPFGISPGKAMMTAVGASLAEAAYRAMTGHKRRRKNGKGNGNGNGSPPTSKGRTVKISNRVGRVYGRRGKWKKRRRKRSMKSRVRLLEKKVGNNGTGTVIKRNISTGVITSANNEVNYSNFFIMDKASMVSELTALHLYNPNTNTLINNNITGVSKNVKIPMRAKMYIDLRNNTSFQAYLTIYYLESKKDGPNNPVITLTNGFTDEGLVGGINNPRWYPLDSVLFKTFYKVVKAQKVCLSPGDVTRLTYRSPWFTANDDVFDHDPDFYFRKCSRFIFIRQHGGVAHDRTTTTQVGLGQSHIDYVRAYEYETRVPGSLNSHQLIDQGLYSTPGDAFVQWGADETEQVFQN